MLDMLSIDRQLDVDMQTIKRIEADCSDLVVASYVHRVSGGDASLARMKHCFSETVCMDVSMSDLVLLVDAVSCAKRAIQSGSCLLELFGM